MKMPKYRCNYRFYATLLDSYQWYLQSESDNAEQEMIGRINRVPITDPDRLEQIEKGSSLNDLIDNLLTGKREVTRDEKSFGLISVDRFTYPLEIVMNLTDRLQGSIKQVYCETQIDEFLVYGYIDYLNMDRAIDLKTTSSYDLGKYKDGLQRHVYSVALAMDGIVMDQFEYLVTDFKNVYSEPYQSDINASISIVRNSANGLKEFIETKKHLITDSKIFNQELITQQ